MEMPKKLSQGDLSHLPVDQAQSIDLVLMAPTANTPFSRD